MHGCIQPEPLRRKRFAAMLGKRRTMLFTWLPSEPAAEALCPSELRGRRQHMRRLCEAPRRQRQTPI